MKLQLEHKQNNKVNFFCVSTVDWGGAAAYFCHMVMAFRKMNYDVEFLKITRKGENKVITLGNNIWGVNYRNITVQHALSIIKESRYNHILHVSYIKANMELVNILLGAGCTVMIHGPYEVKNNLVDVVIDYGTNPIVARTSMVNYASGYLIPYPYNISIENGNEIPHKERTYVAMSGARLSQIKSSGMLLDFNEKLIEDELRYMYNEHGVEEERIDVIDEINEYAIHLYGSFEKNRTKSLSKKYDYKNLPEGIPFFKGNYLLGDGPSVMSQYNYVIDLSNYRVGGRSVGIGDISNFAILEAYDAGSIIIVHKSWLEKGIGLENGVNCMAISNIHELSSVIDYSPRQHIIDYEDYIDQRKVYLELTHSPEVIVPKYIEYWENL